MMQRAILIATVRDFRRCWRGPSLAESLACKTCRSGPPLDSNAPHATQTAHHRYRDGRDLLYRLHSTLEPWMIGSDVSSGCTRLLPEDLVDLYDRVPTGTQGALMRHLV
jgi:L,D-transpeptidase catalytic domain